MRITRTTCIQHFLPLIAVSVLLLSGCGGENDDPAASSSATPSVSATDTSGAGQEVEPKNTFDVDFVTGMIPHHGQAIEMADLALTKARSPKVKDLADRVKVAQAPEIATLSTMLSGWNEPVPAATGHSGSMPGMDHDSAGMMSTDEMGALEAATGAKFDRLWVDMMIAHHEGAVRMSKDEVREGGNDKAQQLAQTITEAQTKEIAELKILRTELG